MSEEDLLFSPTLISPTILSTVPQNYTLRPLSRTDNTKGFFTCLQSLTWTGPITTPQYQAQFDWFKQNGNEWFYNLVIEHENKIVATGVLIVERKFIWGLGKTGHIEDISVLQSYQGKGLGKIIVTALDELARSLGVNKTMLDCSVKNEGFYQRCGFEANGGIHMGHKLGLTAEDRPDDEG